MIGKLFSVSGIIIFTVFSALQINDLEQYGNGDAWAWILIYMVEVLMNLLMLLDKAPMTCLNLWLGFTAGSLFFRLQDDIGNFQFSRLNPNTFFDERTLAMVQQSNECGGLLMLSLWTAVLIIIKKSSSQPL